MCIPWSQFTKDDKIAWLLPRRLVYCKTNATLGDQVVPDLYAIDALEKWRLEETVLNSE